MATKAKCSQCNQRHVFSKGLCSGCYGKNWRLARKAEREAITPPAPKQLTSGIVEGEIVIQGEVIEDTPKLPETHLTALNPAEMAAAQGDMKVWLEQKLTVIERDIVEANAALNEARRNGWATGALTSARNRAVDDETFYNKILMAVEAGHTIIPEFPISVFVVRRHEADPRVIHTFHNIVNGSDTFVGGAVDADCAPAGTGEYRNPQRETWDQVKENKAPGAQERKEPRYYTEVQRTGRPIGPISFPSITARSPIMRATANAMKEKVFDQVGVCHPTVSVAATRQVQTGSARAGDPLVIGQILHKRVGSRQKVVSFIIAWYLNLDEL